MGGISETLTYIGSPLFTATNGLSGSAANLSGPATLPGTANQREDGIVLLRPKR